MLKITETHVFNLENAIRGARNPLASWEKSDSRFDESGNFVLGEADLGLAKRLRLAGSDHRKFMRQIFVSADVAGPLYWWKEFDTYKVGTVANSTSTMHRIHKQPLTAEAFSAEMLTPESREQMGLFIAYLETLRLKFVETNDKRYWYDLISMLPESFMQLRTVTMNYENLINIYFARRAHKLDEWHVFCDWILTLPYGRELIAAE